MEIAMAEIDPAADLESLPAKDGFRLRGLDMTRIETFTDAAFAFALTLLVISLEPARTFGDLRQTLLLVPGFVLSATLLMMFWWGHNQWSRRYGLDDGPTVVLSCLLVFTVLVYVYPLRFMAAVFVSWGAWMLGFAELGGGGGPSLASAEDVNGLFAIYGVGFVAMCGALILLNLHAWRSRDALRLNEVERVDTLGELTTWSLVAGAGVLSVVLALTVPPGWVGVPGWAYMILPAVMPLHGRRVSRRRRRGLERES
jgi:hypothetical protein